MGPALEPVKAWFSAEQAYRSQDHAGALRTLRGLWQRLPAGSPEWKEIERSADPSIADYGTPPAYAALSMLTECAEWRASAQAEQGPQATVTMTIVLVGRAEGQEPGSADELRAGTGKPVVRELDPALLGAAGGQIFDDAYWLFQEYVLAITRGRLGLERRVVHLPQFTAPVGLREGAVTLTRDTTRQIWAAVPPEVASVTDWWHIVYPSHVPRTPAFAGERFVTGGMRAGPEGSEAPCFVSDDRKLLRAANQNGRHLLTPGERRVALAQWFQHEFFHFLFSSHRQLHLEVTPHQWHDRGAWPPDFEGRFEPDYYAEALHKRLQVQRQPLLERWVRRARAR